MSTEKKLFDVEQFCKRHLKFKEWKQQPDQGYTRFEIVSLCDMMIEVLRKESTLAQIGPPVWIVGDIHGQYEDLVRLLNCDSGGEEERKPSYAFATKKWVFLGDYIDRGFRSLECICLVFSLKLVFPGQYILLRGNHETRVINFRYGFRHEIFRRLSNKKEALEVWEKFNEVFSWMPLACLVGSRILCMHGGISPQLTSLESIRNINRPLIDLHTSQLALDLLWADPDTFGGAKEVGYMHNKNRGLSVVFNAAAVLDTCHRLRIDIIVRAHQMMPNGFKFFADRRLCTIFSAPRYMNEVDNTGAFLRVTATGKMSIGKMKKPKIAEKKPITDDVTQFPARGEYSTLAEIDAALKFPTE